MKKSLAMIPIAFAALSCAGPNISRGVPVTPGQMASCAVDAGAEVLLEVRNTRLPLVDPVERSFRSPGNFSVSLKCTGRTGLPYVQVTVGKNGTRKGSSEPFPCAKSPVSKRFESDRGGVVDLAVNTNDAAGWDLLVYTLSDTTDEKE